MWNNIFKSLQINSIYNQIQQYNCNNIILRSSRHMPWLYSALVMPTKHMACLLASLWCLPTLAQKQHATIQFTDTRFTYILLVDNFCQSWFYSGYSCLWDPESHLAVLGAIFVILGFTLGHYMLGKCFYSHIASHFYSFKCLPPTSIRFM